MRVALFIDKKRPDVANVGRFGRTWPLGLGGCIARMRGDNYR